MERLVLVGAVAALVLGCEADSVCQAPHVTCEHIDPRIAELVDMSLVAECQSTAAANDTATCVALERSCRAQCGVPTAATSETRLDGCWSATTSDERLCFHKETVRFEYWSVCSEGAAPTLSGTEFYDRSNEAGQQGQLYFYGVEPESDAPNRCHWILMLGQVSSEDFDVLFMTDGVPMAGDADCGPRELPYVSRWEKERPQQ